VFQSSKIFLRLETEMKPRLTEQQLQRENQIYRGTGGRSQENRDYRFRPAFLDTETGEIYESYFKDGHPAPCHVLDGLPHNVVIAWTAAGRVAAVKSSVISGFVRGGCFYTREQAAQEITKITAVAA
jgi:hypothetical protein